MAPEAGGPPPVCGMRARPATRRDAMALWIGVLAACRGGFISQALKAVQPPEDRCVDRLLDLDPAEVASTVGPPRRGRMGPDECQESMFRAVLAGGPGAARAHAARGAGVRVVLFDDDVYPEALREVRDAPPALFLRGRVADGLRDLGRLPVVAVVGTRGPSPYGREMTRLLSRDLTEAGVLVVSGLAMGVDAVAQATAVEARASGVALSSAESAPCSTVAVLGCGIRVDHPRSNRTLARRIAATGMLLSEFPGDAPASPWRFPCRNRVIAGLARAVVVVEGGEHSGSLLTAGFAMELGRDVLAVPGEAGRRLSAGPHRLLREGAHLCESADDVLDVIGLRLAGWSTRRRPGVGAAGPAGKVLSELDAGERTVDELAAAIGGSVADVAALVSGLEVDGVVARADCGRYRLCRG